MVSFSLSTLSRGARCVNFWSLSVWGLTKLNVDATFWVDSSVVRLRFIARDSLGRVLLLVVRQWQYVFEVDMAEAIAVREGILVAREVGFLWL